jgi:FkbM family methyltransferase
MMGGLRRLKAVFQALGVRGAVPYLLAERFAAPLTARKQPVPQIYRLHPSDARYPVYCRAGSSDKHAFSHVFVEQEYRFLKDAGSPKVILDCGANVGYSAVYFLSQFAEARVISIEPDDRNLQMLHLNTAPYAERSTILHSAVWSHPARLVVCKGDYRDGLEWATQVRECRAGEEGDLDAIDIGSLFDRFGLDHVDVLKMDIEGSERVVFSRNYESWIDRVGCFLIELHGDECRDIFLEAIGREKYEVFASYELTIARRTSPLGSAPVAASVG